MGPRRGVQGGEDDVGGVGSKNGVRGGELNDWDACEGVLGNGGASGGVLEEKI